MAGNDSLVSAAVAVSLDGREFTLRYSAFAFIRYAEATGNDLLLDMRLLGRKFDELRAGSDDVPMAPLFANLRDVVWAGLLDRHPEVTADEVARLIDFGSMGQLMPAIMQAFRLTMPEDAKARPARPPKASRRAGLLTDGSGSPRSQSTEADSPSASSAA